MKVNGIVLITIHLATLFYSCNGFTLDKKNVTKSLTSEISTTKTNSSQSVARAKRDYYHGGSYGIGGHLYPILDTSLTVLGSAAFLSFFIMAVITFINSKKVPSSPTQTGTIVNLGSRYSREVTNSTGSAEMAMFNALSHKDLTCIEWRRCVKRSYYRTKKNSQALREDCPRRPRSCSLTESRERLVTRRHRKPVLRLT